MMVMIRQAVFPFSDHWQFAVSIGISDRGEVQTSPSKLVISGGAAEFAEVRVACLILSCSIRNRPLLHAETPRVTVTGFMNFDTVGSKLNAAGERKMFDPVGCFEFMRVH